MTRTSAVTTHPKAPKGIAWGDIEALLKKGFEPRDIALRLGCSTQNVYARIHRREAVRKAKSA